MEYQSPHPSGPGTGRDPLDEATIAARADHLLDIKRPDEAFDVVGNGLMANPESPRLLWVLARVELKRDNALAAVDAARAALDSAPDSAFGLALLAHTLLRADRIREAIETANAAVAADPHMAWALFVRSEVRHAIAKTDGSWVNQAVLADAIDDIDLAIELDPTDAVWHSTRGRYLLLARRPHDATTSFRRALELDPTEALALTSLAVLASNTDDVRAARRHVSSRLQSDPSHRWLHRQIRNLALRRFLLPLWVASFPWVAQMATVDSLTGEPGPWYVPLTLVFTALSIIVAWWAWRRTPTVERNALWVGRTRFVTAMLVMAWIYLAVIGLARGFVFPFPARPIRYGATADPGLGQIVWGLGVVAVLLVPIWVIATKARGLWHRVRPATQRWMGSVLRSG